MDSEDALQDGKNDTREFHRDDALSSDFDDDDADYIPDVWNSNFDDNDPVFRSMYYGSDDYDDPDQKNYTILKKDDIRKLQEDDITRIFSSAPSIPKDSATMILPYVNGNYSNLTSYEDKKKYSSYLLRYYKRKIKWCPLPGCDCAIEFHYENGGYDVTCSCSYTFCWNCTKESHRPVDCETVFKWIIKIESENMKRIKKVKVAKREKKSSRKYTHYYQHWATQESLRQKAVADLKEVKELDLARLCGKCQIVLPLEDWHRLILEAWLQVVECRRVLKWSYVYGYYYMCEEKEHKRQFFEYLQGQAEEVVEKLHQCSDKEFHAYLDLDDGTEDDFNKLFDLNKFRYKLACLTSTARKHFEKLVKALEKGKGPTKGDDFTFDDDDFMWD